MLEQGFGQMMQKYRILGKKGEGTFSEVLKCQHIQDGTYFACKKMKQTYDSLDQVNNLREVQAMRRLSPHDNILELKEVVFEKKSGKLALVCELMDMNIYELIRGRRHYLSEQKVKGYMYQLLKSLDHMHRKGIFHRDVKPENILIRDEILKLADFGSCRSVYSKQPYTEYISTRWYRAPECLLTDGYYTYKMDLWSVGCVFFEVLSLHPLFPGANEVDQIGKIHDVIGTPDPSILNKLRNKTRGMNFNFPTKKGTGIEKLLPHASKESIALIYKLCTYDPDERISAKQALKDPYFKDLRDADKRKHHMAKMKLKSEDTQSEHHSTNSVDDATVTKSRLIKTKDSDTSYLQPRRRRKPKRFHEGTNFLPKVPTSKLHGGNITSFPSSSYPSTTSFPKIHNGPGMLPSIANHHYNKHVHPKKSTGYQAPSKTIYGHYQLPSIHKSKGGAEF